jgi:hypothetical protein
MIIAVSKLKVTTIFFPPLEGVRIYLKRIPKSQKTKMKIDKMGLHQSK